MSMKKIFYDEKNKTYTFTEFGPNGQNKSVIPPKFSPIDKFGKYRRLAKEQTEKKDNTTY